MRYLSLFSGIEAATVAWHPNASEDGTGRGTPLVAFPAKLSGTQRAAALDLCPMLGAANPIAVAEAARVRRLTPRECERLQAFPDDHTLIPFRYKPAVDGPRYKALGNSMRTKVMRWIGERIDAIRLFQ